MGLTNCKKTFKINRHFKNMSDSIETIKFDIPAPKPPETQTKLPYNKKKWFKKPWILITIALLLAGTAFTTLYAIKYISRNCEQNKQSAIADDANATNTAQTIEPSAVIINPNNSIKIKSPVAGVITKINFKNNELVYFRQALANIGDSVIEAPVVGRITAKYIKLGDKIIPGQIIAEISKTYQSD